MRYVGKHLRRRPKKRGPVVLATAATMAIGGPLAAPARAGVHVVRSGQTLSSIAKRYGVPAARVARANRLSNPDLIVVGQRLRIPGGGRPRHAVHVIRAGETLSQIARRYGTSVAALASRNGISDPSRIAAGDKLRVPRGRGPGAGAASPRPHSHSHGSVGQAIERQAGIHGVDVSLVKAVAWQESGWNQGAVSSVGALGVMQVMPGTARYVNEVLGGGHLRIRVMEDNVHLGVMYLHHMLSIMPTERHALAAYYAGPGNVGRRLTTGQRSYAANVRALKARF